MSEQETDDSGRPAGKDLPLLSQVPLALGVWSLSDNLTLREAWEAVRNDDGSE